MFGQFWTQDWVFLGGEGGPVEEEEEEEEEEELHGSCCLQQG